MKRTPWGELKKMAPSGVSVVAHPVISRLAYEVTLLQLP